MPYQSMLSCVQVAVGAVGGTRTCCTGYFWATCHAGWACEFRRRVRRISIVHRRLYFSCRWGWGWRCTVPWPLTFGILVLSARAAEATRSAGRPWQWVAGGSLHVVASSY